MQKRCLEYRDPHLVPDIPTHTISSGTRVYEEAQHTTLLQCRGNHAPNIRIQYPARQASLHLCMSLFLFSHISTVQTIHCTVYSNADRIPRLTVSYRVLHMHTAYAYAYCIRSMQCKPDPDPNPNLNGAAGGLAGEKQVAQLSQRDRAAAWSIVAQISIVFPYSKNIAVDCCCSEFHLLTGSG